MIAVGAGLHLRTPLYLMSRGLFVCLFLIPSVAAQTKYGLVIILLPMEVFA